MRKLISPNVILEVSKDRMKAYITLIEDEQSDAPKDGKDHKPNNKKTKNKIKIDRILDIIRNIIVMGLKEDRLKQTLLVEEYNKRICIGEGIAPINGKDGHVEYFFELRKELIPKIRDDGTVDYRELDSINNVNKGEQLARLIYPSKGREGYKVTGEVIPYKKGKKPNLRCGKNVALLDDGITLVAGKDGLVNFNNGRVTVSEILELSDVDKKVGNVYFNGTVIVRRNVLNGYKVRAYGDVEVKGLLEGGYIQNTGDVLVKQGIQGYNRLTVQTKGNLVTKFIENSRIESGKNITAEAIMHSYVDSQDNVIVIGKRGLIVGGVCRAGNEIRARTIGSSMATTTVLEIGVSFSVQNRARELKDNINNLKDSLGKVIKSMDLLDNIKKSHALDDERFKMYIKLVKTKDDLTKKLSRLKDEERCINKKIKKTSEGKIKVAGIVHPGVKVIIGNCTYFVKDEMKRCTFYKDEGGIRIGPY